MNLKKLLFVFAGVFGLLVKKVTAQDIPDSTLIKNDLQKQIDQLQIRVDSLESELGKSKENMVSRLDVESIFRSVNEGSQEFTDEDRRSKRRALDSLFRVALEKPGQLTFTGQFMTVFHWDGKTENSINTAVGTIDLFAFSSFGKGNLAFINLQAVGGDGPSWHFNSFSGFHAGAGTTQSRDGLDRVTILEAWTEFKIKFAVITAGKIDLTNYFDPNSVANDEYSQFLSNGLVDSSSLAIPGWIAHSLRPGGRLRSILI